MYCNNRIFNGQTGVMLIDEGINGVGSNITFGALIHQVSAAALSIHVISMPAGIYSLRFIKEGHLYYTAKIVKQ